MKFEDLSVDEVNMIFAGLGKLPLEMSVTLWQKLRQQAEEQMKPLQAPQEMQ